MTFLLLALLSLLLCDVRADMFMNGGLRSSTDASLALERRHLAERVTALRKSAAPLVPLVIIPAFMGSKLYTKFDKKSQHWWCPSKSDWYTMWFPPETEMLVPATRDCWLENFELRYNFTTHLFEEYPGVTTEIRDYGGVSTIYNMLAHNKSIGDSDWNYVIGLLLAAGYEAGVTLRGAPYEWRTGPDSIANVSFPMLKALIEETYNAQGQQKVALTSLSMGGIYTMTFLNSFVDQAWKDQYIHSSTSFSGAFGGSILSVTLMTADDDTHSDVMPEAAWQRMVRSTGPMVWMTPFPDVFNDSVVVTTPRRNYTAAELNELYIDAGVPEYADLLPRMADLRMTVAPGVPVNCVFGLNSSTQALLQFTTDDFAGNWTAQYGDGDNAMLVKALDLCSRWRQEQTQPAQSYPILNMVHANDPHTPAAIKVLFTALGVNF